MRRLVPHLIPFAAVIAFALAISLPGDVRADALDNAKAAGQVGERFDGYLGVVSGSAPASVQQLVNDINARRRARYQEIAQQRGTSIDAVAAIAASEVIERTPAGQYVMPSADSGWVRK